MKNQGMGLLKMALVLILLLVSGWYFSGLFGALASLFIFLLTVLAASYFICAAYDVPDRRDGFQFMLTFIFGLNYPAIVISEGHISEKSRGTPGAKIGGPGLIKVDQDSAAVVVRGKTSKVIGPGAYVTRRGEKVKEAVDLRPQIRMGDVTAMTKDGFEVTVDYAVGFQIHTGGREPTPDEPFPFAEEAVRRAVYRSKQVGKEGAQTWHERIPGFVFGPLREIIATHRLDDLFEPDNPADDPRARFRADLQRKTEPPAHAIGVRINWVSFGTPRIPDEAIHKYVEHYVSKLQSQIRATEANAQKTALETLVEALRTLAPPDERLAHLVRIRFIEALETITKDKNSSTILLPYEALEALRAAAGGRPGERPAELPPE
jgi:regulator of protease activity HflC (stomatin/prohibitin superfamily)